MPGPYTIADLGGDVLVLLDRLGLKRVSYCGLPIGGMVGQWLAIKTPERIARLILICTSARLPPACAWRERAAIVREAGGPEPADRVLSRWFTDRYAAARTLTRDRPLPRDDRRKPRLTATPGAATDRHARSARRPARGGRRDVGDRGQQDPACRLSTAGRLGAHLGRAIEQTIELTAADQDFITAQRVIAEQAPAEQPPAEQLNAPGGLKPARR